MKHLLLAAAVLCLAQDDAVRKLIEQLSSDDFEDREKASGELVKIGKPALPELEKAAKNADAEVRSRAEAAIRRIKAVSFRSEKLLEGRKKDRKETLEQSGGGADTEAAVLDALRWLARHQSADGSWSVKGHRTQCGRAAKRGGDCAGTEHATEEYDAGVAGLAMLAFLGSGYSHLSKDTHDDICFGDVVRKGIQWMMSHQDPEGCIGSRNNQKYMYGHAVCALALAESYGLTGSNLFKDQAQKAADFTIAAQNPGKGWRYSYKSGDNDSSVTFWCALGLGVAQNSGLRVPGTAFEGAHAWFDEVTEDSYGRVGYTHKGTGKVFIPGQNETFDHHESLTAMGATIRMLTRGRRDETLVVTGCDLLLRDKPLAERNSIDYYYWHMGTLALFQLDGPAGPKWQAWNKSLKEAILKGRRREEGECRQGSWDPVDRWGGEPGRVYATAINALTLQTYYRYRIAAKE